MSDDEKPKKEEPKPPPARTLKDSVEFAEAGAPPPK